MIDFPGQQFGAAERGVFLLYHPLEIGNGVARRQPKLHLIHHDGRKRFQLRDLTVFDRARFSVDDAQCAQIVPVAIFGRSVRLQPDL